MSKLLLHEFHEKLGAHFQTVNGAEVVSDYGNTTAEYTALNDTTAILDLSFRSRICLTGTDRVRFLHGQVTNDITRLRPGEGCYAALTTSKGRMESDLNIYQLKDELLLDFEPGLAQTVSQRLEKYIVSDDVQMVDVSTFYGVLSVQGPKAAEVLRGAELAKEVPTKPFTFIEISDATHGEIYVMNQPRLRGTGFDLFIPNAALEGMARKLVSSANSSGGTLAGWAAFETARIEAGIPRFGADMDETNIPIECGIEARAISYNKGCYIGQEVLNRIHTLGHVNKSLRGLRLTDDLKSLPVKGDKLFHDGKEVGCVTSAAVSPKLKANIALAYIRREVDQDGTELVLRSQDTETPAKVETFFAI